MNLGMENSLEAGKGKKRDSSEGYRKEYHHPTVTLMLAQ
jgi:hypothetical protein